MRTSLALCGLAVLAASAQTRIVINAGVVIDGNGGVAQNRQILIDGSRIVAIGTGQLKPNYDLSRYTLMPGWIDTHVHLNWHCDADHKNISGGREPGGDQQRYTAA